MPPRSGSPRTSGTIRAWSALLEPYPAERRTAEFRGIEQPMTVLRVGSRNQAKRGRSHAETPKNRGGRSR